MNSKAQLENTIFGMLSEKISAQLGDSGIYGYSYEKYADNFSHRINFPSLTVDIYGEDDDIIIKKKLPNFLYEHLSIDHNLTKEFKRFYEESVNDNLYDLEIMKSFAEYYIEKNENMYEITGTFNSYNFDSALDGIIQFVILESMVGDKKDIIILQTHNGADVRGGYSKPRVFELSNGFDDFLTDIYEIYIPCDRPKHESVISYDGGYSWKTYNDDWKITLYYKKNGDKIYLIAKENKDILIDIGKYADVEIV